MPHYRIYRRGPDGHLDGLPHLIELVDDDAAVKQAREEARGRGMEVWEGTRLVAVILADGT
jgi:hypothetical protein